MGRQPTPCQCLSTRIYIAPMAGVLVVFRALTYERLVQVLSIEPI